VGVVAVVGLVLDVRGVDGDTTGLLLGGIVNLVISLELGLAFLSQNYQSGKPNNSTS